MAVIKRKKKSTKNSLPRYIVNNDIPQANLIAAQMYDAVWLYAKSLKRAVDQNYGIEDGEWLVESMTGSKWNGKT